MLFYVFIMTRSFVLLRNERCAKIMHMSNCVCNSGTVFVAFYKHSLLCRCLPCNSLFCVWWMMNALDVNAFLYIKIKAVIKRMFISLSRSFTRSFSTLRRVLLNVLIMKNNYKPSRVSFQLCVLIIAGSQIILSVESKTSVVFFIIKKG